MHAFRLMATNGHYAPLLNNIVDFQFAFVRGNYNKN